MSTASHSDAHHEQPGLSGGHIVPIKFLVAICAVLLFLTAVTVWVAKLDFTGVDMPELNIFIAMAVATVKMSLVILFFMHLRWDRSFSAIMFIGSIGFVLLFITFAMIDTAETQPLIDQNDSLIVQQKLAELEK